MPAEHNLSEFVGRITLLWGLAGSLIGCGGAPAQPWETVYPVNGVIHLNGQPLANALITLVPEDGEFPASVRPSATSNEDGTFELGTYQSGDGAPPGSYQVTVLRF